MNNKKPTNHLKGGEYFVVSDKKTKVFLEEKEDAEQKRRAKSSRLRALRLKNKLATKLSDAPT